MSVSQSCCEWRRVDLSGFSRTLSAKAPIFSLLRAARGQFGRILSSNELWVSRWVIVFRQQVDYVDQNMSEAREKLSL